MNPQKLKLGVLALLSVGILALRYMILTPTSAVNLIMNWGYWIMLVGVVVYASQLAQFLRARMSIPIWRKYRFGILIALLGAVFLQVHEPTQFKVLRDEHIMSGVARNMHFLREATFPLTAHFADDRLEIIQKGIDKRPLLFHFALACLHDLTGYRPENVFVLNAVAAFSLLLVTYYFGAQYGGWQLGTTCVALWLSLPLLAQCATGGGYDILNVLMLALLWFFGREYLRAPSLLSQNLFVLTAVHLAQVRQESVIYIFLLAAVVLWQWLRRRGFGLGWIATFSPLYLVLPVAINLFIMQTPALETSPGQIAFSLNHIPGNLQRAVWYLFNFSFWATNSVVLSVVGVLSIIAFSVKMFSTRRQLLERPEDMLLVLFLLYNLVGLAILFCSFWGQWDDPAASRFSLPLHLLFILCFGRVAKELWQNRPVSAWIPFCALVVAIAFSTPAAARFDATRFLLTARESAWFLKELEAPGLNGALVIAPPVGPILYNHPAIGPDVAEAEKWKINECLKNGIYREIVVLERFSIDHATLKERPYNTSQEEDFSSGPRDYTQELGALSEAFRKETISEIRLRPDVISRISRIISVAGAESMPPKGYLEQGPPFTSKGAYLHHLLLALP
jgi:hypothetical protein